MGSTSPSTNRAETESPRLRVSVLISQLDESDSPIKTQLKCHLLYGMSLYQPGPLLQKNTITSFSCIPLFQEVTLQTNVFLFSSVSLSLGWAQSQMDAVFYSSFTPSGWDSTWHMCWVMHKQKMRIWKEQNIFPSQQFSSPNLSELKSLVLRNSRVQVHISHQISEAGQ